MIHKWTLYPVSLCVWVTGQVYVTEEEKRLIGCVWGVMRRRTREVVTFRLQVVSTTVVFSKGTFRLWECIRETVCECVWCICVQLLVFSGFKRRCVCMICFLCVRVGGGEVHQSATCSQSCGPAPTPWITEQAAHEEHTHTDGHSAGPGPAVNIGWHTRAWFRKPHRMTYRQHPDRGTVSKRHACIMKKQVNGIANELWLCCAGRTRCWSFNPWLKCWWIADHCFNSHWNVTDMFDLDLTEGRNSKTLLYEVKWLTIVTK